MWRSATDRYELSPAELELLTEACRMLDRADEARALVDDQGLHVVDRFGGVKLNPVADFEARCRRDFASSLRALGIREAESAGAKAGPAPYTARRR